MKFSDLHCHNHLKTYFWVRRKKGRLLKRDRYHPWTIIAPNVRKVNRGKPGFHYNQCDLVSSWNGDVRLTFNSLYPIEKGFFMLDSGEVKDKQALVQVLLKKLGGENAITRDIFQRYYMGIPVSEINYFQSKEYNYWEYLAHELEFTAAKAGVKTHSHILYPTVRSQLHRIRPLISNRQDDYLTAKDGIYDIPGNRKELKDLLQKNVMVMILTIEGAHVFGTNKPLSHIKKRIKIMRQWTYPVFFITLAHHFFNGICGHARSIPEKARLIFHQETEVNSGFTPLGKDVLLDLLALDKTFKPDKKKGYRILIDVKHMAARSRKHFYQVVNKAYEKGDNIPVIASHVAYSGRQTLDQLIAFEKDENDNYLVDGFNGWNINVCDEDIEMIFKTKGLAGISFDQRILGVPESHGTGAGRNNITAVWKNLRAILNLPYNRNFKNPDLIWDRITIGTDFDGYIDPVGHYSNSNRLSDFADDLKEVIEKEINTQNNTPCLTPVKDGIFSVEEAIRKICFNNAEVFVRENYPE